jgi:hypothetical protein
VPVFVFDAHQALRDGAEASCLLLGSVEKVEFFFGGGAAGESKGLLGAVLDEIIGRVGDGVVVEFAKLQGDIIFDLIAGGGGSVGGSSSSSIRVAVESSGSRRIIGLKESRFRSTGKIFGHGVCVCDWL